ncbi:hypothetical protein CC86DRAFT_399983 [Ophiobolus disseminans]|uniref:EGF-like domain-containing protein n=1 Tax=Ophiobolus disseminans TaxID=1469910 RepID=A0A6A7AJF9_9PLEO|nr:hypothetical protein CC86DRAFT_399983 [Ophiobolus disseminans]
MLLILALFVTTSLASCTFPLPAQKRDAQYDSADPIDVTYETIPDIDTPFGPIDLPPEFLPSAWSPSSNLGSPYPDDPIDDGGRSQMIDNEVPFWHICSNSNLDCAMCPRDARCKIPQFPEIGDEPGPPPPLLVFDDDILPEDDGQQDCPLQKCDEEIMRCGSNARCTRGFCVCDLGMKGTFGYREN